MTLVETIGVPWNPRADDDDSFAGALARLLGAWLGSGTWLRTVSPPAAWVRGDGHEAAAAVARIVDGITTGGRAHERGAAASLVAPELNRHAHRVHLCGAALARLVPAAPPPTPSTAPGAEHADLDEHACLDLRFDHHGSTLRLYATVSVWSAPPCTAGFGPGAGPTDPTGSRTELTGPALGALAPRFLTLAAGFRRLVEAELPGPGLAEPPTARYWVVTAGGAPPATEPRLPPSLGTHLLGVPAAAADAVAVTTVVDGPPRAGRSADLTLTVVRPPDRPAAPPGPGLVLLPVDPVAAAARETAAADLVCGLVAREARREQWLADVAVDLAADGVVVDLYAAVVHTASLLWDDLALYLPETRSAELDGVHRLVELVHLTLLQGLADLQATEARTVRTAARAAAGDGEQPGDDVVVAGPPIDLGRSSARIETARRDADHAATRATGVLARFDALLGAISHAFDERRVRDTDKIGRAGLVLALALASVGVLTETLGAMLGALARPPEQFAYALGVLLVLFGVGGRAAWRRWSHRQGDLATSAAFRDLYPRVRSYIGECRSGRLDTALRVSRAVHIEGEDDDTLADGWRQYHEGWRDVDASLATRFAELVDDIRGAYGWGARGWDVGRRRTQAEALGELLAAVERWALITVLVTERPPAFRPYPLPRLMLLHRFYPVLPADDLRGPDGTHPELVGDVDLALTLREHCAARPEHVEAVLAWGERQRARALEQRTDAREMLAAITRSGVRGAMSRRDWDATLARIAADGGPS